MTGQLPLDLRLSPRYGEEDFLENPCNAQALALVRLWPNWPRNMLLLSGPKGSGKSHLGAIWAFRSGAKIFAAGAMDAAIPPILGAEKALLLEDAEQAPEKELFHLINLFTESGGALMLTASRPPDFWGVRTPDLLSRLRRMPQAEIAAPDEIFIAAILIKLFDDRQIRVEETTISYLAARIERSLAACAELVEALDREALAQGRAVTRAFAGAFLRANPRFGCGEDDGD
ncbi:chromosomal replication initiation ATPase DnaA [Rhodoblastus acidophilus]|uniref:DnaA ATPase domain-containing protein n=1 Tax=Rhodoblastus acidophilus TaxID=1074 RepID=UPI0022241476|nr:DnaA/Hda family protein [Rhodoblastus acidophilus]MCW2282628.1 chromosomal replication initiation ATPase DnaA [Rhodoblastus acidophilus]MCW2331489.1 chromosomal replication initiation ATPase DnaA [Rhodoblastus acidophilus]